MFCLVVSIGTSIEERINNDCLDRQHLCPSQNVRRTALPILVVGSSIVMLEQRNQTLEYISLGLYGRDRAL